MTNIEQAEADFETEGGLDSLANWIKSVSDLVDPVGHDPSIDIRLRYHNESWFTYSGSSDYDQDHRGYWGSSCVVANMTLDDCRDTAIDLREQTLNHLAECSC